MHSYERTVVGCHLYMHGMQNILVILTIA